MRSMSIGTKISLIVIGIFILFSSAVAVSVVMEMRDGIKTFATEKAKRDLEMANHILSYQYPGDWAIKDGQLYKGMRCWKTILIWWMRSATHREIP